MCEKWCRNRKGRKKKRTDVYLLNVRPSWTQTSNATVVESTGTWSLTSRTETNWRSPGFTRTTYMKRGKVSVCFANGKQLTETFSNVIYKKRRQARRVQDVAGLHSFRNLSCDIYAKVRLFRFFFCFLLLLLLYFLQTIHRVSPSQTVVARHDEQSEGLPRRLIIEMVQEASGGELSYSQAANTWDKTVHKRGMDNGILTGYLKTQEGTSKRTAAGNSALQLEWYNTVTDVIRQVRERALEVLDGNEALVDLLMPDLLLNTDEENLSGTGKNEKSVGSKRQKKHNNQNKSSRCQQIIFFL